MLDIRLKEIYVNLKNHDFDVLGRYKMDKNEANKFIDTYDSYDCKYLSLKWLYTELKGHDFESLGSYKIGDITADTICLDLDRCDRTKNEKEGKNADVN